VVWNIKSQQQRFVDLTPDDTWGGAGLLGVTIRLDNYGGADERLIRVLEVEEGSPASIAGLVSLHDFLLGTNVVAFESTETLAAVLHQHVNQIVELYVYNAESDIVRVVPLVPSLSWGRGQGLLGAEVGTGYLHRLPGSTRSTSGSSVERKVRWINRESGGGSTNQTSDNNPEDHATASTATGTGTVPDENTPLELEPHLEMEVEHENDRRRPEDITKQPHQLGEEVKSPTNASSSSSTATTLGGKASLPQNIGNGTPNSQEPSQMPPTVAAASATSSTTIRPFPDLAPLPPPPQVVTSPVGFGTKNKFSRTATAKQVDDAEALFSGPPPSTFLPPPPKMMT
jgi:GRASP55/65 PDZ-like domain